MTFKNWAADLSKQKAHNTNVASLRGEWWIFDRKIRTIFCNKLIFNCHYLKIVLIENEIRFLNCVRFLCFCHCNDDSEALFRGNINKNKHSVEITEPKYWTITYLKASAVTRIIAEKKDFFFQGSEKIPTRLDMSIKMSKYQEKVFHTIRNQF